MNKIKRSVNERGIQENKRTGNKEEASDKRNLKLDVENDTPQNCYGTRASGHSTPISKKEQVADKEDSPELEYHCSPIPLPFTQEGASEVAWDWQSPAVKRASQKSVPPNNLVETPTRAKKLLKKRSSNSPLLQKPLKRKLVKMENIENIGKFTAELKALTEKMKNMQQDYKTDVLVDINDTGNEVMSNILEFNDESSDDIMAEMIIDNEKVDSVAVNNNVKKSSSYEDLFDDSIDDSMVRCSQEIEAKLNIGKSKENEMEQSAISEKKESSLSEKGSYCLTISAESSKSSNITRSSTDTSSHLKVYSNNTSKTSSASSFSLPSSKNASLQKDTSKNTHYEIAHTSVGRLQDKGKDKDKNASDFPDDSFDDCLATCVEDDKLLTKLSEYDFNGTTPGHNSSSSKRTPKSITCSSNKPTSSNHQRSIEIVHDVKSNTNKKSLIITDTIEEDIEAKDEAPKSLPGKNVWEQRKFFKTKSLSDQCSYISESKLASNLVYPQRTPKANSVSSSVSTTYPVGKHQHASKYNNVRSINGTENTHALNRLEKKEEGNYKYKSTSNLSSTKESQQMRCTPEEIERKRMEAKLRLEAKRKLQTSRSNAASEVPIKRSVKR